MFQVIAAAFGLVTSANNSASAQHLIQEQENADSLNYYRTKGMILVSSEAEQNRLIAYAAIAVVLAVIVVIFLNRKKG